jgi:oxepin-CoA hydrolase/3-oxo-5,6-dehydrosuberyl-CoA semialdehyde dehydrogenase
MQFEDFRNIDFDRLSQLPQDLKPQWGSMTLQHMMEHLGDNFRISNGTVTSQVYTPLEKVDQLKRISLLSDRDFPKGITSPMVPGEPLPYRTAGVKAAVTSLA